MANVRAGAGALQPAGRRLADAAAVGLQRDLVARRIITPTSPTTASPSAQDLVRKDADTLQRLRIPASAIWLDRPWGSGGGGLGGWGNFDFDPAPNGFPHPVEMIGDLASRNMYLLGWIANRANNDMLTSGIRPGHFQRRERVRRKLHDDARARSAETGVFAHFKNRPRDSFVKRGMRGFKIDRGEQGEVPVALQNELAILTAKAAYDATTEVLGAEGLTFGRNVYDRARKYPSASGPGIPAPPSPACPTR